VAITFFILNFQAAARRVSNLQFQETSKLTLDPSLAGAGEDRPARRAERLGGIAGQRIWSDWTYFF
jgi:hypothetical protein